MSLRLKIPKLSTLYRAIGVAVVLLILTGFNACSSDFTDEEMQPLAATAADLARSVRRYASNNPEEAQIIDDQELVRRSTAHDPSMMEPYKNFIVRGLPDGVILICSKDGRRGLVEDAACSNKVDSKRWHDQSSPCAFLVDLTVACASTQ